MDKPIKELLLKLPADLFDKVTAAAAQENISRTKYIASKLQKTLPKKAI